MATDPKKLGNWTLLSAEDLGLSPYTLKLDAIKKKDHLPAFVEKLIKQIEDYDHITVGDWIQNLPHLDFIALEAALSTFIKYRGLLENKEDEKLYITDIVTIVLELLSVAEGLEVAYDVETKIERFHLFRHYIEVESMKRRGDPVEVIYEYMTLDEDADTGGTPDVIKYLGND